tara:strand:- start:6249 stop:6872 length:624 start_codon:yes stop_codon:yes gene_type:complete
MPNPTRMWSRVENRHTYDANDHDPNALVNSPITGDLIPVYLLSKELQMIHKGNILQYKHNAQLSKTHNYVSKIRNKRVNRNKTIATQGQKYTNPNISNFQRVNFKTTESSVKPTDECFNININQSSFIIKDGGTLINKTQVNPCTYEEKIFEECSRCHLTTSSGVPGNPQRLCWNPRISIWNPRRDLTMGNSGDKWPTNVKFLKTIN